MFKSIVCILMVFSFTYSLASNQNKTAGSKVSDIKPGSTAEKLGLQVGDVILSFDNRAVNSPSDAMDLYTQLKEGTVKTVVIERDGKKQTLTY